MSPRTVFIGDIQGCASALRRLLDHLQFDPSRDRLRFAGDLVNRGGESLEALRLAWSLRAAGDTVLGNHDLHLLAYAYHHPEVHRTNHEFEAILGDPDGPAMLDWLRRRPLMIADADHRIALVHAGIDPRWDPDRARACAGEVEEILRGPDYGEFLVNMYGDEPRRWKKNQEGWPRLRTITNVLTRMRYCDAGGRLDFATKTAPGSQPAGYRPWFEWLSEAWRDWTVVHGHWSTLGLHRTERTLGLDSGCVWGGQLSAWVVDESGRREVVQVECDQAREPGQ